MWRETVEQVANRHFGAVATAYGRLAALALRLGLPELTNQEAQLGVLWDELGRRERWLLIYDNAERPRDLGPYRPPAGRGG
jgi:hypothetical protein